MKQLSIFKAATAALVLLISGQTFAGLGILPAKGWVKTTVNSCSQGLPRVTIRAGVQNYLNAPITAAIVVRKGSSILYLKKYQVPARTSRGKIIVLNPTQLRALGNQPVVVAVSYKTASMQTLKRIKLHQFFNKQCGIFKSR